jgi:hypothetical protein
VFVVIWPIPSADVDRRIRWVVQRLGGVVAEWAHLKRGCRVCQGIIGGDGRFDAAALDCSGRNVETTAGSASSGPPGTDAAILCLTCVKAEWSGAL